MQHRGTVVGCGLCESACLPCETETYADTPAQVDGITYQCILALLADGTIKTSQQQRTLLKNLGSFLGKITLARWALILPPSFSFAQLCTYLATTCSD